MFLESPNGHRFSIAVISYEFPDESLVPTEVNPADAFDDARFLLIACDCRNESGQWRCEGAVLTTTQLQNFIAWLQTVRDRRTSKPGFYFTERDLEFSVDEACSNLRVHLSWQFLPPWLTAPDCLALEFPLDSIQFASVINSLQIQVRRFPGKPRP